MESNGRLPDINRIGMGAPFRWLGGAWLDLWRAPLPLLAYGFLLAVASLALSYGIYATNAAFWVLALTFGFVFVAPMLAMGPYEAGRLLEAGGRPTLAQILFVRSAMRQDIAYLGLALLLIYFFWGRMAQLVYALSTFQMHPTIPAFVAFAVGSPEGHNMLVAGTIAGGVIAWLTFMLVAVSAPMLLDPRANVFAAVATSVRAVTGNTGPMLLWAAIIAVMVLASAMTGFVALTVVFPWLGLASWRAYRALVAEGVVEAAAGAKAA